MIHDEVNARYGRVSTRKYASRRRGSALGTAKAWLLSPPHAPKRKDTVSREQVDDPLNINLEKVAIETARASRPRDL